MADPINIGLDFGSLGCRAACVVNNVVLPIPMSAKWDEPARWLFCERSPSSVLGVHFPSIKSRVGMEDAEAVTGSQSASAIVSEMLNELHSLVNEHVGRPAGHLVIAVPALYSAARRATLRELALAASFTDVHLLNDSMAAVIAHTHQREAPLTALVYSMGYSGFELGLIRVAKGHFRAIAYDGGSSPGGAGFDALIMRAFLQVLGAHNVWLPLHDFPPDKWLHVRSSAQSIKERLSTKDAELKLAGDDNRTQRLKKMKFLRKGFEQIFQDPIASTLDAMKKLVEDSNLTISDVDEVLLVGGSTRIPVLQRMIEERFSHQPITHAEGLIAQGAAFYAMRLGMTHVSEAALIMETARETDSAVTLVKVSNPAEALGESVQDDPPQAEQIADSESQTQPIVLSLNLGVAEQSGDRARASTTSSSQADMASLEDVLAGRESLFQHARQLISQGLYDRAEGFLQGLMQDAQILLETIPSRPMPARKLEVDKAFHLSDELLDSGRFQQAVEHAHYAYTLDPENPEVFQRMIDIHCRAAMAHSSIDGYEKSMQWLNCAFDHDRTNTVIHDRIAERHFIHAQQIIEQGNLNEALRAVEHCLYFSPEHAEAKRLKVTLLESQRKADVG